MLVSGIAHKTCPIEDCLIIHFHSGRPARHDKLLLVARGIIEAAGVTKRGQRLIKGRSLFPGVCVKEILQLELALVGDTEFPELDDGLRRHGELSRAILRISLFRLETAIAAALPRSE